MPMSLWAEIVSSGPQWGLLLFLIGIPAVVVWVVVWGAATLWQNRGTRLPDPEQILKVRLARGEIDLEEYERLRGMVRDDR